MAGRRADSRRSHPRLTNLKNEEIIAELGWTKKILKDILGVTPKCAAGLLLIQQTLLTRARSTFRPPYGDIE